MKKTPKKSWVDQLEDFLLKKAHVIAFGLLGGGIITVLYFIVLLALKHYWIWGTNLSISETGEFGDFVGGFVGTIISAAGFLFLYLTLKDQRKATEDQRKSFEKERFENRFFELLRLYKENVQEIFYNDPTDGKQNLNGRETFSFIFKQVMECYSEIRPFFSNVSVEDICRPDYLQAIHQIILTNQEVDGVQLCHCDIAYSLVYFGVNYDEISILLRQFSEVYEQEFIRKIIIYLRVKPLPSLFPNHWQRIISANSILHVIESIEQCLNGEEIVSPWNLNSYHPALQEILRSNKLVRYYRGHQDILGHYFRHIFQTVNYVDKQKFLSYEEKYEFIKTLRAQLSIKEQYLFFFNSLSFMGWVWEYKYLELFSEPESINKYLITKYNFIKNLSDLEHV